MITAISPPRHDDRSDCQSEEAARWQAAIAACSSRFPPGRETGPRPSPAATGEIRAPDLEPGRRPGRRAAAKAPGGLVESGEDGLGFDEERLSIRGQGETVRLALERLRPELFLVFDGPAFREQVTSVFPGDPGQARFAVRE